VSTLLTQLNRPDYFRKYEKSEKAAKSLEIYRKKRQKHLIFIGKSGRIIMQER
jgi:hypothetical protein